MSVNLDQFLEDSIRTIYKNWYQPKVESAHDELDRARYELADQLQALGENDKAQAEDMILAFIEKILTIEHIPEMIPDPSRVMNDAINRWETEIWSTNRTDLSPPRRQDLSSQLSVANPAVYIISTMHFSPEKLQNEWEKIMRLRQDKKIGSLLMTSDEPWIPWELVKPYGFDEDSAEGWEDGFLSETFQLCRWLPGRSPMDEVTITSVAMIAPDVGLRNTEREVEYLQGLEQQSIISSRILLRYNK